MKLINRLKKKWLIRAMKRAKGNKSEAARWLGLSYRTFNDWEIKLGIRGKKKPVWEGRE